MHRTVIRCAAMLLLLLLSIGTFACSGPAKDGTPTDTENADKPTEPNADAKLPDGALLISSENGCRIVYAEGYKKAALSLYDGLLALDRSSNIKIGYYEVSAESRDDGKTEIYVGDTGSELSRAARQDTHGFLDYAVHIERNGALNAKIAIFGYTDGTLSAAAELLLESVEYIDGVGLVSKLRESIGVIVSDAYPLSTLTLCGVDIAKYKIVLSADAAEYERDAARRIYEEVGMASGAVLEVADDGAEESEHEILIGRTNRAESGAAYGEIDIPDYSLIFEGGKAVLAYGSPNALAVLLERIFEIAEKSGDLSENIIDEIKEDSMIVSSIEQLRDPCILLENGVYYAYGTGWVCYKNESGLLEGDWTPLGRVAVAPEDAIDCYWAPEVHKYNGYFYMFTTYKSAKNGHRGCTVLRSESPAGPFVEISDGHLTPSDWDAIDGTLYIDGAGDPWMVFVHEWTSTDDGVGRMAAARLSDDLSRFITEPIELFRADDPSWSRGNVTDGCWMYRCESGELLMIWSNWDAHGYCVGIARSDNGEIDGNWTQDDELLYSKSMTGEYDGGHGMIFTSINGQMYLSIHSPNNAGDGRKETPVFIAICEKNGTLAWDKW